MFGNRTLKQILRAGLGKHHYVALANMLKVYPDFAGNLWRYLSASGAYPRCIKVRTPVGQQEVELYSHHDLLTVNEIFCRLDYRAGPELKTVVDVGSNIGISALYFLTRNSSSRCYLFEPNPNNIGKLKRTLTGFEGRYTLETVAVSDMDGRVSFGVEDTGRYGGIGISGSSTIEVDCVNINRVLNSVLETHGCLDVLKIDTEGHEIRTVAGIQKEHLKRIRWIYLEAEPRSPLHPEIFESNQYGTICQLRNRTIS